MKAGFGKAEADAIIVGAGPAGAATALLLARAGFRAVVVEKKTRARLAKPLTVSVEESSFADAGIEAPEPPERLASPGRREIISAGHKLKIELEDAPLILVNLPELVTRLVEEAEQAGVRFMFEHTVTGPVVESGQVTGVAATDPGGKSLELSALLSIDASGILGVLRHYLDEDMGVEREISPLDVVNAWQDRREIDREAVLELVRAGRIRPQVNVIRVGFMGPFSMLSIYVDLEDDRVDVTAGLMHDSRLPTAKELVEKYVDNHGWIGESISSAGGLIPVRRPLDTFVADGFACVGDAACQAVPVHASGIASSLEAARILSEVAARALDEKDLSKEALWPYNARYMHSRGGMQANSDLFRRFLLSLTEDRFAALLESGLITHDAARGSLAGVALEIPKSAVIASAARLIKSPALLYRLLRLAKDTDRAIDLYEAYPGRCDPAVFERWQAEAQTLFDRWNPQQAQE